MYLNKQKVNKKILEWGGTKYSHPKKELWTQLKKLEPARKVFARPNFYNMVNGLESMNIETLKNLCNILGVKKEEIL